MAGMHPLARELLQFLADFESMLVTNPFAESYFLERRRWAKAFYPRYPRRRVFQAINRLKSRGYLSEEHNQVRLTPAGLDRVKVLKLSTLALETTTPWDGIWRVVIWDIPESERSKRDRVRALLISLKFVRIQKSIWVTPYICREQITYLRDELGLGSGLIYLEARYLEGARALRRHFNLVDPAQSPETPTHPQGENK